MRTAAAPSFLPNEDPVAAVCAALGRDLADPDLPFADFYRLAWTVLEPATAFLPNWHIDLIAEHLEAVTAGQIQNLRINIQPRVGKSLEVSVAWPVWSWLKKPELRYLCASYSGSLSTKHSVDRRTLIRSNLFQLLYGHCFQLADDNNLKTEFSNDHRGHMIATSIGGTATGKGGKLIIDDPLNPMQADSKVERESSIAFVRKSLMSRLDDKKKDSIVLVEQRLHRKDVSDAIASGKDWEVVDLPAIADKFRRHVFPRSGRILERKVGSLLWPAREGEVELAKIKERMGSRAFNAQYQQSPSPEEGNLVKREWFSRHESIPAKIDLRVWSWDTAFKTGQSNDFTVGQLWARCEDGYYLEHEFRARLEFPELIRQIQGQFKARPASAVLIEDKASGQSAIQTLKRGSKDSPRIPIIAVKVDRDKVARVNDVSPLIEAGRVYLPLRAGWLEEYLEEWASFPEADHDDRVDATSQALRYMERRSRAVIDIIGGK